ncbi:MAG: hypothetical protein BGP05_14385 [Rhizobiales bacterium 62-47]|nr:SPW repeat protein [Hyphomicrobiales bacterium]OJY11524.1 MAG: hypothetical protein BGP05_14385 [Rhizobiales bacterium 62-47]
MSRTAQTSSRRRESVLNVYSLAFAAFLFISPWLFSYSHERAKIDLWISGLAVVIIAVAAIVAYANWKEWLKFLLGVWLIVSPWILGFAHTKAMHVSIAVGIGIAFVSLVELLVVYDAATDRLPSQ